MTLDHGGITHDGHTVAKHQWFTSIGDSTPEDWELLEAEDVTFRAGLADRVRQHLLLLDDQGSTFHVTRLEHSLQSATMAHRAGKDDAYVACALLHDLGDSLASYNHADMAAAVLRPFVTPEHLWMIEKHAIFQGYYFWHMIGGDREAREEFRGHPYFELTEEFCAEFDNPAFDPAYPWMPLDEFRPLLADIFSSPLASRGAGAP